MDSLSGYLGQYTTEVFHSPQKTRQKYANATSGELLGGPLTDQQSELMDLWNQLSEDEQQSVLEFTKVVSSKKHECD